MKNYSKNLAPLAVLVLFGACGICALGFVVVVMEAVGFGGGLPFFYFQRLSLPLLSVALPVLGMILFALVLTGISGESEKVIAPSAAATAGGDKSEPDEIRLKAA
jgi:hypothetical protein